MRPQKKNSIYNLSLVTSTRFSYQEEINQNRIFFNLQGVFKKTAELRHAVVGFSTILIPLQYFMTNKQPCSTEAGGNV